VWSDGKKDRALSWRWSTRSTTTSSTASASAPTVAVVRTAWPWRERVAANTTPAITTPHSGAITSALAIPQPTAVSAPRRAVGTGVSSQGLSSAGLSSAGLSSAGLSSAGLSSAGGSSAGGSTAGGSSAGTARHRRPNTTSASATRIPRAEMTSAIVIVRCGVQRNA
jgi:hypothetical protein